MMFPVLAAALVSACDPEPKVTEPPADGGGEITIDECVDDGDTKNGCK